MEINQYDIVIINLDPTMGKELKKTRPCVVISPDEINRNLAVIVIAPLTTTSRDYPTRVLINQEKIKGWIVLDQIRAIDKQRILRKTGNLSKIEILNTKSVLKETYVD